METIEAINEVLRANPQRWPFPSLSMSAHLTTVLMIGIMQWVAFQKAKDLTSTAKVIEMYDYIIVGGGTAGMIVATRIANSSSDKTVLLLEAGGEPPILNEIPAIAIPMVNYYPNNWIYNTTPQRHAAQCCNDRKAMFFGGKMLGGSSCLNFMMYVRGNPEDFNRWSTESAGGDPQWSYKGVLPFFKKFEDYNGNHKRSPDVHKYHGKGGLLNIAKYDFQPGGPEFLSAAKELGYRLGDYNGVDQNAFSAIDVTTQGGFREHTYRAYYKDTGKPPNLSIRKFAVVTKIMFQSALFSQPKATGVIYLRHKIETHAFASKEVILCAGTMGSAKLLLLSGVGPRQHLDELEIPVVADLPVGKNLQDHVITVVGPLLRSPSNNPGKDLTPDATVRYINNGSGPLATPAALGGIGFYMSPFATPQYPDLEVVHISITLYTEFPSHFSRIFGFREDWLDSFFDPYHKQGRDGSFLLTILGRPKSVGYLKLASKNPGMDGMNPDMYKAIYFGLNQYDNLIINPNFLKHPDDMEALLYGYKKGLDLAEKTRAFNTTVATKFPGCEHLVFRSDEYYRCGIRLLSASLYHQVGTCALGKVVDNSLRVKGIKGLRVIDASVIPFVPNGNTQAATIMIGEKGADLVIKKP